MTPSSATSVGARVVKLRNALRLTQVEFAKATDIGRPTISGIENGSLNLTVPQALGLCEKYQITLDWLYRGRLSSQVPPDIAKLLAP
jgi:transcriptional regulator with XRE-family HTH domain